MNDMDLAGIDNRLTGNLREYMIYFEGLTDDLEGTVSLEILQDEMPYRDQDVLDDLENLEERDVVEAEIQQEGIYPKNVEGFNKILENTRQRNVEPSEYSLGQRGVSYFEESNLDRLSDSLRYTFNNKDQ